MYVYILQINKALSSKSAADEFFQLFLRYNNITIYFLFKETSSQCSIHHLVEKRVRESSKEYLLKHSILGIYVRKLLLNSLRFASQSSSCIYDSTTKNGANGRHHMWNTYESAQLSTFLFSYMMDVYL